MPAVGGLLLALLVCAGPAQAAPSVLSVGLSPGAVAGGGATLTVAARDEKAPVSGLVVRLADQNAYATSACRAPVSFPPGSTTRIAAPVRFDRPGPVAGFVRVQSGGCNAPPASVFQPFTVTPARDGEPPSPVVLGIPLPDAIGIPPLVGSSGKPCRGANRKVGRSKKARRTAARAVLCLINRIRRQRGLRPLRRSRRLGRAASGMSRAMVRLHFFGHVQPGGVDLVTRLRRTRYLPARSWLVGENLAAGTGRLSTPVVQLRAWMRSSGHRANILNGRFRDIGLGVAYGVPGSGRGGTYTTDFGWRR